MENTATMSLQAYQECKCIEAMRKTCGSLKGTNYFFNLASQYFNPEWIGKQQPKVIVMGTALPPEIVYAYTAGNPYWVFGGSRAMTDVSDSDVPRDTDPVSRSMLGYLQAAKHMAKDALVIVPLVSDNQRKLAYILKDQGWNVETVHIPPYISIGGAVYEEEIRRLCSVLNQHLKKRLFPLKFKKAALLMEEIGHAVREFTMLSSKRSDIITGSIRMLVLNSFFMTQDLNTWLVNLKKLSEEISILDESLENHGPQILLVGSPIYFPCYKVPFLLEDIGIDLCGYIDPGFSRFDTPSDSKKSTLSMLAASYLKRDMSSAYIRNESLCSAMREQIEKMKPDGLIWHILRGQNEYDFEQLRLEEYITEQMNLPVFRLETDYQYQDVEQLRVRMEAFSELISHRIAAQRG